MHKSKTILFVSVMLNAAAAALTSIRLFLRYSCDAFVALPVVHLWFYPITDFANFLLRIRQHIWLIPLLASMGVLVVWAWRRSEMFPWEIHDLQGRLISYKTFWQARFDQQPKSHDE